MASISKTPNGTWTVRWRADGTQPRATFDTKAEAERHARNVETAKDRGEYINPADARITVAEHVTQWHNTRINLRPTSADRDDSYIRNLINPRLGQTQLRHLTPAVTRQWVASLTQTYAPATIHKAHSILKAALNQAINDRVIATNPCHQTPLPKPTEPQHRYLTAGQVHDLADAITPQYQPLVWLGATAGLRPGELAALRVANVDLKTQRITVTHTATERKGQLSYGPPKTPNSRRTISIGAELTRILGQHFETWVPNFNVADITAATSPTVFTGPEGGPFRLTNFRRRHWKQAVSDSVGAPMRIHDLRHTAAALAIEQGAQPKVLSERLGHRDISTTYNTYGHLFPGYDETLADDLDAVFSASR